MAGLLFISGIAQNVPFISWKKPLIGYILNTIILIWFATCKCVRFHPVWLSSCSCWYRYWRRCCTHTHQATPTMVSCMCRAWNLYTSRITNLASSSQRSNRAKALSSISRKGCVNRLMPASHLRLTRMRFRMHCHLSSPSPQVVGSRQIPRLLPLSTTAVICLLPRARLPSDAFSSSKIRGINQLVIVRRSACCCFSMRKNAHPVVKIKTISPMGKIQTEVVFR